MTSLFRNRTKITTIAFGNFLAVQWLGLCASTAKDTGSIPGRGTINKLPQAMQHSQRIVAFNMPTLLRDQVECRDFYTYVHIPSDSLSTCIYFSSTYSLRNGAGTRSESGHTGWKTIGRISSFRISWQADPTTRTGGFAVFWSPLIKQRKRYLFFFPTCPLPSRSTPPSL